jgi:hypothetical protein
MTVQWAAAARRPMPRQAHHRHARRCRRTRFATAMFSSRAPLSLTGLSRWALARRRASLRPWPSPRTASTARLGRSLLPWMLSVMVMLSQQLTSGTLLAYLVRPFVAGKPRHGRRAHGAGCRALCRLFQVRIRRVGVAVVHCCSQLNFAALSSPVLREVLADPRVQNALHDGRFRKGLSCLCVPKTTKTNTLPHTALRALGQAFENVTGMLPDPAVGPVIVHIVNLVGRLERENNH